MEKFDFDRLQREHRKWAHRNYPHMNAWRALVKLGEEVSELVDAVYGGVTKDRRDEAGDVLIALAGFCNERGLRVERDLYGIRWGNRYGGEDVVLERDLFQAYGDLCRCVFKAEYWVSNGSEAGRVNELLALCRIVFTVERIAATGQEKAADIAWARWEEVSKRFEEEVLVPPPAREVLPNPGDDGLEPAAIVPCDDDGTPF